MTDIDTGSRAAQPQTAPRFTVVNEFTLKDPDRAAEFEERFLDHVSWMRQQAGYQAHQAVRVAGERDVYLNLGWWSDPQSFQRVMADDVFRAHAAEFHTLVEVDADPSLSVLRYDAEGGGYLGAGATATVRVERFTVAGDAAEFERAYDAYAAVARTGQGFGHLDLARSVRRPGGYTAATWWWDETGRREAERSGQYAVLGRIAGIRALSAAPLAGDRAAVVSGRD
ncbi:antibiotic biosynthesis monooxygenase family protein [Streptomyces sp. HD]|uniref:antibiotic biosynthesis monooxygenase family protein n=1 Tax=Streptomyces sp. HD TaxID=3020892 RepID=UPI002330616F|nr:antibiotic biosynthesis monooxygenase family protein [Streptomyces sp. HD]MDC0772594.1 antibiotic biosynthesis monooxygenase [Streptomyces sp. HD]